MEADEIILLLRVSLSKLRLFADQIDFEMLLDETAVKKHMEKGNPAKDIRPIFIDDGEGITPYKPYQYIYGKYSQQIDESLYWRPEGMEHPFRDSVRLKLCALLLESRMPGGEKI